MVSASLHRYFGKYQRYFGIFFILLFLGFSLLLITYVYDTARTETLEQTRHELMTTAEGISVTLDADALADIRPEEESAPGFLNVRDQIRKYQGVGDIRYVYIMKMEGSNVTFLVDGDFGYDPNAAVIGEVFPDPPVSLLEGFSRPSADREFTTDRWGTFLSGYAPVRDTSGRTIAMVGVDMDESRVRSKMDFLDSSRVLLGLFIVVLCAVGAIILDHSRYLHEAALTREVELRRESERILKESLEEKTVMLQEIHHRVNNNLQVLISLINLQSRTETDPRAIEALRGCQTRIVALAVVHELLYVSKNVSSIEARQYLERLGRSLIQFYRRDRASIPLVVRAPGISLNLSVAIPVGLIMNELISNSIRHAFFEGKTGTITIDVEESGEMLKIVYHDDGCGLPEGINWKEPETLGFRLISSLAGQLDGTIEMLPGPGLAFRILVQKKLANGEAAA